MVGQRLLTNQTTNTATSRSSVTELHLRAFQRTDSDARPPTSFLGDGPLLAAGSVASTLTLPQGSEGVAFLVQGGMPSRRAVGPGRHPSHRGRQLLDQGVRQVQARYGCHATWGPSPDAGEAFLREMLPGLRPLGLPGSGFGGCPLRVRSCGSTASKASASEDCYFISRGFRQSKTNS